MQALPYADTPEPFGKRCQTLRGSPNPRQISVAQGKRAQPDVLPSIEPSKILMPAAAGCIFRPPPYITVLTRVLPCGTYYHGIFSDQNPTMAHHTKHKSASNARARQRSVMAAESVSLQVIDCYNSKDLWHGSFTMLIVAALTMLSWPAAQTFLEATGTFVC